MARSEDTSTEFVLSVRRWLSEIWRGALKMKLNIAACHVLYILRRRAQYKGIQGCHPWLPSCNHGPFEQLTEATRTEDDGKRLVRLIDSRRQLRSRPWKLRGSRQSLVIYISRSSLSRVFNLPCQPFFPSEFLNFVGILKGNMTTRSASDTSENPFHRTLRVPSATQDTAYLDDDLLMDTNDSSTPLPRYERSNPAVTTNDSIGDLSQLVIAIDYGTTYTGKKA